MQSEYCECFLHQTNSSSLLRSEAARLWAHHAAVGRLGSLLALALADSAVLHYNTVLAAKGLRAEVDRSAEQLPHLRNITQGESSPVGRSKGLWSFTH